MIQRIINSSPTNAVVDCYSLSPVKKSEILDSMTEKFGLRYEVVNNNMEFDATGLKPNYYLCFYYSTDKFSMCFSHSMDLFFYDVASGPTL